MKNLVSPIIISIAVIIGAMVLGNAYKNKSKTNDVIGVTGLGEIDFTSNLVNWQSKFYEEDYDLKTAYAKLEDTRNKVKSYLMAKGVKEDEIVFDAIETTEKRKRVKTEYGYEDNGDFDGYRLDQDITVVSKNVEEISVLARQVTELLNQGIKFETYAPTYTFSDLASLKKDLLSKAAADARDRAEKIAENSGEKLGALKSSRMGVFQITGQGTNEDYSWGGAFNTTSKNKTASITVRSEFYVR